MTINSTADRSEGFAGFGWTNRQRADAVAPEVGVAISRLSYLHSARAVDRQCGGVAIHLGQQAARRLSAQRTSDPEDRRQPRSRLLVARVEAQQRRLAARAGLLALERGRAG